MGRFILVSLGLLVMALSIRGAKNPCLKEWYFRNQRCYKVFKEQKTWDDAEAFCVKQKAGCHLASIHTTIQTADMADYIAENLKIGQCVWIGLHDPKQNDEWVWINRHETNYISWADDYPDHSKKEKKFCAQLEKETNKPKCWESSCGAIAARMRILHSWQLMATTFFYLFKTLI